MKAIIIIITLVSFLFSTSNPDIDLLHIEVNKLKTQIIKLDLNNSRLENSLKSQKKLYQAKSNEIKDLNKALDTLTTSLKSISNRKLLNNEIYELREELKRIQYQNKYIDLNNIVMGVDTDLRKLEVSHQEEKERFKDLLQSQQDRYEVQLLWIYTLTITLFSLLTFLGYKTIKTEVYKRIALVTDTEYEKKLRAKIIKIFENNNGEFIDRIVTEIVKTDKFENTVKTLSSNNIVPDTQESAKFLDKKDSK